VLLPHSHSPSPPLSFDRVFSQHATIRAGQLPNPPLLFLNQLLRTNVFNTIATAPLISSSHYLLITQQHLNMAKAVAETNGGQKTVPADCVSVLLMALDKTTITRAQYEMMSALDGNRTASSFEHQFRSITAKAKELKSRADNGESFEPVRPANKRSMCNIKIKSVSNIMINFDISCRKRYCFACYPEKAQECQR
jgi:hypothetical protein